MMSYRSLSFVLRTVHLGREGAKSVRRPVANRGSYSQTKTTSEFFHEGAHSDAGIRGQRHPPIGPCTSVLTEWILMGIDLPIRVHTAAGLVLIECKYYFMAIPEKSIAPGTFPGFHSLEPVVQWTNSNTQTIAVRDKARKRRNTHRPKILWFSFQINFRLECIGGEAAVIRTEAAGVLSGY
jgi:hypothetical protein